MLIVLIRHAEREYRPDREEAKQVLTPKGIETATRLGQKLAQRLQAEERTVSRILTSTYERASQTAALIAPHLGLSLEDIEPLAALQTEPDGSVEASVGPVLAAAAGGVAVFGHGPDLAELSRRLGGQPVELKKSQALAIEWNAKTNQGQFLWQIGHKKG